jgi:hypothetical protein
MADNVTVLDIPTATREVSYSGSTGQHAQVVGIVAFSGSDDAKVATDLPGDATNGLDVDITRTPKSSSAALSNFSVSTSSATAQAANTSRKKLIIVNDSEIATLKVKYGATASATSFTHRVAPGETLVEDMYTGIVDGIWDQADAAGAARVTELT